VSFCAGVIQTRAAMATRRRAIGRSSSLRRRSVELGDPDGMR